MIPEEAVEAAHKAWREQAARDGSIFEYNLRAALEAAAPYIMTESDLMRWKLEALREWSDAMICESNWRQYGIDVKTILDVASMDEAEEVAAL